MLSQSALTVAAAGVGLCFLGYCVYFDRKRRSDPFFRQKLRERRRKAKQLGKSESNKGSFEIPDLKDAEAVQRFFLQEVQLGEEMLASGDIENGVEHLGNAVAVCGQPQQLLQVLQQSLPAQVFQLLLMRLPLVGQRLTAGGSSQLLAEDDLE